MSRRGALPIWLDGEMTWLAPDDGRPGRPAVSCGAAVQVCRTIKDLFKLPRASDRDGGQPAEVGGP